MSAHEDKSNAAPSEFHATWAFPSELVGELGAKWHASAPLEGQTFKSGRQKWETVFTDERRRVIARRPAMQLVGKASGRPYVLCRRDAEVVAPPRVVRPARQAPTLDDLLA